MGKLRIRRRGYQRDDGTRVRGTSFLAKDRGKPGRGPKLIEIKKPGSLGEGFFDKSSEEQKRILGGIARNKGERVAGGKMRAVQVLNKRTNPSLSKKAKHLAKWVYDNY